MLTTAQPARLIPPATVTSLGVIDTVGPVHITTADRAVPRYVLEGAELIVHDSGEPEEYWLEAGVEYTLVYQGTRLAWQVYRPGVIVGLLASGDRYLTDIEMERGRPVTLRPGLGYRLRPDGDCWYLVQL